MLSVIDRFIADLKERRFEEDSETDPKEKKSLRKRISSMKFSFAFVQGVKRR